MSTINWNNPKFGKREIKEITEVLESGYDIPTRICPSCGKTLHYKSLRNYNKSKAENKTCNGCAHKVPIELQKEKARLRKKAFYQVNKKRMNKVTVEYNNNHKEMHHKYVKRWKIKNKKYNDEKERIRAITKHYFKNRTPCKFCGSIKNLEFHHLIYKKPVEESDFIVLCKPCHAAEHARMRSLK